jgi:hypothetical protein
VVQHLREVAIDHTNGIFAGTNNFVEEIGGCPPLTVEAFVAKHRDVFEVSDLTVPSHPQAEARRGAQPH